jgi:ATP-binding cassette subfamily A (ABC1) protein 1
MKILTGNLAPSSGRAILDQDIDLFTKRSNIQIGYCPQFDALIDNLTVREHLELFSRLKLSQCLTTATLKTTLERNVAKEVDRLIQELTLKPFEHKLAGTLSGGNKRKLSVAIAMVNCPSLLFLDEPSTGMDPFSKRFLWDVILKASVLTKKSTIFLTTHSMEESEALCNKASIMVNGKLKCFGSIQHLKNRFGKGFLLEFKLNLPTKNQIQDTLKSMNDQKKQEEDGPLDQEEMKNLCRRLLLSSSKESLFLLEDLIERKEIVGKKMVWFRFEVVKWILIEMWMEHLINYLQQYFGKTCVQVMKKQMDFCRIQMSTHRSSSHSSKGNETNNENEKNNETMILLSQIFDVIENAKNKYHIKDYSVSQTTLEQIFHSFARLQKK